MSLAFRNLELKRLTTPTKRFFRVGEVDYTTRAKPTRQKVKLGGLIATQPSIHAGFRTQKNPTKGPISIFRSPKGQHYIIEGHHRSARAVVRGDKHIDALVYREPRRRSR